jgi:hypothetical protein
MTKREIYKSSDMALVTAVALFFPIKNIDKINPKKVEFNFDKTSALLDFIDKYWGNEVVVNPIEYFNQIKNVKRRLYEEL